MARKKKDETVFDLEASEILQGKKPGEQHEREKAEKKARREKIVKENKAKKQAAEHQEEQAGQDDRILRQAQDERPSEKPLVPPTEVPFKRVTVESGLKEEGEEKSVKVIHPEPASLPKLEERRLVEGQSEDEAPPKPKKTSPSTEASKAKADSAKAPREFRSNRVFILDTNVLLHDAGALFAFEGVIVGIPFVVLEELDKYKKESNELGRNAREVIRQLDAARERGSLHDGVELEHGTQGALVKIYPAPEDCTGVCKDVSDNQIIATMQKLVEEGNTVTLVTKDINARVKADSLKLDAEDYTKGKISLETFYKGWQTVAAPAADVKSVTTEKIKQLVDVSSLSVNEFVIVHSEANPENARLFRYLGGEQFKQVMQPETLGSFGARNIQQLMALDLLLDDDVRIVSLLGPAGTGKTFLALLVGLFKVVREQVFRKFLVTRPIVALGADVGYLPGELKDKLHNWMMPIHDNLEYIFSEISSSQLGQDNEFAENAKERRRRRRHPEKKHRGGGEHHQISNLERKGLLSMEAITYMRGRSIPDQYMFVDEVQNLTPHEVKTLVSRVGKGTKIILAGDPHQIDSPFLDFTSNGLTVTSDKFRNQALFGTAYLEISERSEVAQLAAELL